MKEKLQALLKSEGLKSSQLAEILEINPAGISHILAGRNRPGFDLLQKILRRFPQINPDWLLLDSEQMYRDSATSTSRVKTSAADAVEPTLSGLFASVDSNSDPSSKRPTVSSAPIESPAMTAPQSEPHATNESNKEVERIVVLYTDGTFKSFIPRMR